MNIKTAIYFRAIKFFILIFYLTPTLIANGQQDIDPKRPIDSTTNAGPEKVVNGPADFQQENRASGKKAKGRKKESIAKGGPVTDQDNSGLSEKTTGRTNRRKKAKEIQEPSSENQDNNLDTLRLVGKGHKKNKSSGSAGASKRKKQTAPPKPQPEIHAIPGAEAKANAESKDPVDRTLKGPSGQKVYNSPKGGKYYFNANGIKVYLRKDNVK